MFTEISVLQEKQVGLDQKEIKALLGRPDYAAKMVYLATMASQSPAFLVLGVATVIAVKMVLTVKTELPQKTKKVTVELKVFPEKRA